jgi:hypothetical protein
MRFANLAAVISRDRVHVRSHKDPNCLAAFYALVDLVRWIRRGFSPSTGGMTASYYFACTSNGGAEDEDNSIQSVVSGRSDHVASGIPPAKHGSIECGRCGS